VRKTRFWYSFTTNWTDVTSLLQTNKHYHHRHESNMCTGHNL